MFLILSQRDSTYHHSLSCQHPYTLYQHALLTSGIFCKAHWELITNTLNTTTNKPPNPTSDPNIAYSAWCSAILDVTKQYIPCGCHKDLIPMWDAECQQAYYEFTSATPGTEANMKAKLLTDLHDVDRRDRLVSTIASIDLTHYSRQDWQTFNCLTGCTKKTASCPISANAIASLLIENGRHRSKNKQISNEVNAEIAALRQQSLTDHPLKSAFTGLEILAAIGKLKCEKAQDPDRIALKFIINCIAQMTNWLKEFFSNYMIHLNIQMIWKRVDITVILKPNKPTDNQRNYRPISSMCVPLKLLERLFLS